MAASHFSVMVRGTSQMFVAGPPVVKWGVGEDLDKEELGGADIHAHMSGAIDNEAESETDAFAQTERHGLSEFPYDHRIVGGTQSECRRRGHLELPAQSEP